MVLLFSSLWVTHWAAIGLDFIVIVPLLPSHWGFFCLWTWGILFYWVPASSCQWFVQQITGILVFSQKEMDNFHHHEPIQLILKEINPEYSLEELVLKMKLQYFDHLIGRDPGDGKD